MAYQNEKRKRKKTKKGNKEWRMKILKQTKYQKKEINCEKENWKEMKKYKRKKEEMQKGEKKWVKKMEKWIMINQSKKMKKANWNEERNRKI